MTNLILLISDGGSADRQLRLALSKTAPECSLERATTRAEILSMQTPRLILLDLMLSNESAFDILRWIRTEERYKDVPVFVLAPQVLNMDVKDAYALGANSCFIQKPAPEGLGPIARGIAAYASLIALSERACA